MPHCHSCLQRSWQYCQQTCDLSLYSVNNMYVSQHIDMCSHVNTSGPPNYKVVNLAEMTLTLYTLYWKQLKEAETMYGSITPSVMQCVCHLQVCCNYIIIPVSLSCCHIYQSLIPVSLHGYIIKQLSGCTSIKGPALNSYDPKWTLVTYTCVCV